MPNDICFELSHNFNEKQEEVNWLREYFIRKGFHFENDNITWRFYVNVNPERKLVYLSKNREFRRMNFLAYDFISNNKMPRNPLAWLRWKIRG